MTKDYSIKTAQEKAERKVLISNFTDQFGDGSKGLTKQQKKNRIEKILGDEKEKVIGFGKDKNKGVEFFTKAKMLSSIKIIESFGIVDFMTPELKNNISNFPNDPDELSKPKKNKVLNVVVHNNGVLEMDGIALNGKEFNVKERSTFGITTAGDEESAIAEKKQFEEGILKEVSDRTMAIHEANGDLDVLLEDPNIDTDEDKPIQY